MIQGFWHIMMVNEYLQIVTEQLRLMKDSGLYESVDKLHLGCIGSAKNLQKVSNIVNGDKIIYYHDRNVGAFEFFTLKILKHHADSCDFNGFYIHTKAVTWPKNEGGKYWRDYMNYYNITRWKDCLDHLNRGYETCGVKLLSIRDTPAFKMHYSGNFFWFKSSYVKTLTPIKDLNLTNRLDAEMWICSACPIAATLCQTFVDYNTKGKFIP